MPAAKRQKTTATAQALVGEGPAPATGAAAVSAGTDEGADGTAFERQPTMVFINGLFDTLKARIDALREKKPTASSGIAAFSPTGFAKAIEATGEYTAHCNILGFRVFEFAHGQSNLPPTGEIIRASQAHFQHCDTVAWPHPVPVAVMKGTGPPKAGELRRAGCDSYYFGFMHAWATAVTAGDKAMDEQFQRAALRCTVKFDAVASDEALLRAKWAYSASINTLAASAALHGVRFSIGLNDENIALKAQRAKTGQKAPTVQERAHRLCA